MSGAPFPKPRRTSQGLLEVKALTPVEKWAGAWYHGVELASDLGREATSTVVPNTIAICVALGQRKPKTMFSLFHPRREPGRSEGSRSGSFGG